MKIDPDDKRRLEYRLMRTLCFLKKCNGELCPVEDLNIEKRIVPWCSEGFCEHKSLNGIECYRKWIMGEKK